MACLPKSKQQLYVRGSCPATVHDLFLTSISGRLLLLQEPEFESTPTLTNTQLARAASGRLERANSSSSASSHHAE